MKAQSLFVFFIIAYGIPFGVEAAIVLSGTSAQIEELGAGVWTVWALYIVAGLGAWAAMKVHGSTDAPAFRITPIPWVHGIVAAFAATAITVISFGVQLALGVIEPDWELNRLTRIFDQNNLTMTANPAYLLFVGFVASVFLGIVLYGPLAIAGEFAWRGFLMARLEKLGRLRAYLLTGLAWGVWFAPLAFTDEVDSAAPWSTVARLIAMAIILSVIIGELAHRTGSLVPGAMIVGAFAAQITGMTTFLVPRGNPPWSGSFGYVSVGVWLVVALAIVFWSGGSTAKRA